MIYLQFLMLCVKGRRFELLMLIMLTSSFSSASSPSDEPSFFSSFIDEKKERQSQQSIGNDEAGNVNTGNVNENRNNNKKEVAKKKKRKKMKSTNSQSFSVGGYLPDYRSYLGTDNNPSLNHTSSYLTDLILFSIEPRLLLSSSSSSSPPSSSFSSSSEQETNDNVNDESSKMSVSINGCCLQSPHYQMGRQAKAYHHQIQQERKQQQRNREGGMEEDDEIDNYRQNDDDDDDTDDNELNLWVTVGGAGGRMGDFTKIISNSILRKQLIEKILDFTQKEQIDGIDLNVYQPTTIEEHENFELFIREAWKMWHPTLLISIPLFPNQQLSKDIFINYVDRIHLMTYDMIQKQPQQQQSSSKKNNNNKKYPYTHHGNFQLMKQAIDTLVNQYHCPSEKVHVGIPAYSRNLYQPGLVKTFAEIYDGYLQDIGSSSSTSVSSTYISSDGYGWDSPLRIQQKIHYLYHDTDIGGIFFWELGQDKIVPIDENVDEKNEDDNNNILLFPSGGILVEAAARTIWKLTSNTTTTTTITRVKEQQDDMKRQREEQEL